MDFFVLLTLTQLEGTLTSEDSCNHTYESACHELNVKNLVMHPKKKRKRKIENTGGLGTTKKIPHHVKVVAKEFTQTHGMNFQENFPPE